MNANEGVEGTRRMVRQGEAEAWEADGAILAGFELVRHDDEVAGLPIDWSMSKCRPASAQETNIYSNIPYAVQQIQQAEGA